MLIHPFALGWDEQAKAPHVEGELGLSIGCVLPFNWYKRAPIYIELKYVGARIMTRYIEATPGDPDAFQIDFRVENSVSIVQRAGRNLAAGRDNDGIPGIDPIVAIRIKRGLAGQCIGNVSRM